MQFEAFVAFGQGIIVDVHGEGLRGLTGLEGEYTRDRRVVCALLGGDSSRLVADRHRQRPLTGEGQLVGGLPGGLRDGGIARQCQRRSRQQVEPHGVESRGEMGERRHTTGDEAHPRRPDTHGQLTVVCLARPEVGQPLAGVESLHDLAGLVAVLDDEPRRIITGTEQRTGEEAASQTVIDLRGPRHEIDVLVELTARDFARPQVVGTVLGITRAPPRIAVGPVSGDLDPMWDTAVWAGNLGLVATRIQEKVAAAAIGVARSELADGELGTGVHVPGPCVDRVAARETAAVAEEDIVETVKAFDHGTGLHQARGPFEQETATLGFGQDPVLSALDQSPHAFDAEARIGSGVHNIDPQIVAVLSIDLDVRHLVLLDAREASPADGGAVGARIDVEITPGRVCTADEDRACAADAHAVGKDLLVDIDRQAVDEERDAASPTVFLCLGAARLEAP